jgi:hypothetical protein
MKYKIPEDGVAALLTIVIVGAASLIMAYSASILALGDLELGYDAQKGSQAFSLADGCVEEAMRRLRLDDTYSGSSLSIGSNSCIIGISSSGLNRTIVVTSTVDIYHKKLEAQVSISGSDVTLNSWEEKYD